MIKKLTLFILSLVLIFLSQLLWLNTEAYAYDLSIPASMDKFVDKTGGYDYYDPGDGNQIFVGFDNFDGGDYGEAQAAIQFDLSDIDTSKTIQSANLKINITTVENLGGLDPPYVTLYSSDTDGWTESSDTSLPSPDTAIVSDDYDLNANSWKSFDVTNFITAQAAGDDIASFLLTGVETGSTGQRSQFCFYDRTVTGYAACLQITYVPNSPPTVTTQAVINITSTTATGNGNITDLGVPNPTAHGVCWNTTGNPTTADSTNDEGAANSTGAFTSSITGLSPNTKYYVKAYAANATETAYGSEVSFTSSGIAPTISTQAVSAITSTTATGNGTITDLGLPDPTAHGVCWNTTGNPTITDSKTDEGAAGSTGAFTSSMTGLSPNTTYYVKAYAANTAGTAYGSEESFATLPAPPAAATNAATGLTTTGATLNGTINASNQSTTVTFEYGLTTAYGTTVTADQSPVTGTVDTAVSKAITGLTTNTTYHYRVAGVNDTGTTNGTDLTFTTLAVPPTVTTNAATGLTITGATLNGTVNANNAGTTVTFEYGLTDAYGTTVTADQSPATGTADTAVSKTITGLTPNTVYHYQVVGVNDGGTTNGTDLTFTTSPAPPAVTTNAATGLTTTGATLNGTVNANNQSTMVTFEYGLTTAYGTAVTADQSPLTGTADTAVSKVITGLTPNTTYHYRVVGVNVTGTTNGVDLTFTTLAVPPAVTTEVATGLATTGATLNGTVNANNASTTVTFEYGLTNAYGTTVTADQPPVTGSLDTPVSKAITGLTPNNVYHYRVVGVNAAGNTNGADLTFTTSPAPPAAATVAATGLTTTGAALNGTVNANNQSTVVTFEYGLTTAYGSSVTADQSPLTGTVDTAVSKAITGLTPNTTYHYRVAGVNDTGTANGTDLTFTTSRSSSNGGGNNAVTIPPVNSTTGSALVYPNSGGTIALGNEVQLDIPAGSLQGSSWLKITCEKVISPPAPPSGFVFLGNVYEWSVNGSSTYNFRIPVTLTFTYDPTLIPDGLTPSVSYYDTASSRWVLIGGIVSDNTITVTVDHFTKYAVIAAKAEKIVPAISDISGHWAEPAIRKLIELGAIKGYSNGTFKPDQPISRAEFAAVLVKAMKLPPGGSKTFKDTANHWARDYISTAVENGIVSGYDTDIFGPDDLITREQMAVMIVKAAKLDKTSGADNFTDNTDISAWASDFVATACINDILTGYLDNTFRPRANASRAEAAMVITQILE